MQKNNCVQGPMLPGQRRLIQTHACIIRFLQAPGLIRYMSNTTHQFDAIILGGGIAGLWLLSLLRNQGYEAILLEKEGLGSGQTFASQGMIHGGIKYSLAGAMTGASESGSFGNRPSTCVNVPSGCCSKMPAGSAPSSRASAV